MMTLRKRLAAVERALPREIVIRVLACSCGPDVPEADCACPTSWWLTVKPNGRTEGGDCARYAHGERTGDSCDGRCCKP